MPFFTKLNDTVHILQIFIIIASRICQIDSQVVRSFAAMVFSVSPAPIHGTSRVWALRKAGMMMSAGGHQFWIMVVILESSAVIHGTLGA